MSSKGIQNIMKSFNTQLVYHGALKQFLTRKLMVEKDEQIRKTLQEAQMKQDELE